MPRSSFDDMTCSIARTLDVLGEWWTPLVLRDIFAGVTRFDAIHENLGISRKVLAQRLNALVEHDVLQRVAYQYRPTRYDYRLTDRGADLAMVLLAMQSWGDRWIFGTDREPVVIRHGECGALTKPELTCAECGEPLTAAGITALPGPGFVTGRGSAGVGATHDAD